MEFWKLNLRIGILKNYLRIGVLKIKLWKLETWKLFKNGSFENWNFEELFEDEILKIKNKIIIIMITKLIMIK